MTEANTTTLYDRLGRRDGITRITRELIKNHMANTLVSQRYSQIKDMDRVERNVIDFFCAGSGGPETYAGKDMLNTHRGMNISEQELIATIDDVVAALRGQDIGATEVSEVVAILYSLKGDVLRT